MVTKVQQWGNSLGVRIPKVFAEEVDVKTGSSVEVLFENGQLIIRPIRQRVYKLKDLLNDVTNKNKHDEIDVGLPQGKEAW